MLLTYKGKTKYLLSQIGNMDETPVMLDVIGNKKVDVKETKIDHVITTGHKKYHFTIILSCLADSTK